MVIWASRNVVLPYGLMSKHMEFLAGGRRGDSTLVTVVKSLKHRKHGRCWPRM